MSDTPYPEARAVTRGPRHHFFGYYDKCPWDATGRYLLALETSFIHRPPEPEDTATIGLVDLRDGDRFRPIAETRAWNWQMGTMLHWLPQAPDRLILYNDRVDGRFVGIIRDVFSGETRTLPRPVYAITRDGRWAVSLNFARVHQCRPGYGYAGVRDPWEEDPHPAEDGIYLMDLQTGANHRLFSLAQVVEGWHRPDMDGVKHWFNHLQFNPAGSRFIFLHRWYRRDRPGWFTQFFTAARDGSEIYCLNDDDMTSHFDWRDNEHILAWARTHGVGDRYFLFTDRTAERQVVGEGVLTTDGHCSYSPDGRWILTDTYPDKERMRTLLLYRPADGKRVDIGRFFAPRELDGEIRCDLHPRWSRDGRQICFDSVHEGERQMYVVDVSHIVAG
ncbi:MAG: hypothetical protein QHJ73_07310 [Armatimonadota bacterium]|nr:hypothetical protein [Armatimonadota bacterium]